MLRGGGCADPWQNGKTQLLCRSDDGPAAHLTPLETSILQARSRAFERIQDRSLLMTERIRLLLEEFEIRMPQLELCQWAEYFLSLEQLDPRWKELLLQLQSAGTCPASTGLLELEIPFEQLVVYFIYRHLPQAQDETDIKACLGFAVLGFVMIRALCQANGGTLPQLLELARLYSSEIEYSEENTAAILDLLWAENN